MEPKKMDKTLKHLTHFVSLIANSSIDYYDERMVFDLRFSSSQCIFTRASFLVRSSHWDQLRSVHARKCLAEAANGWWVSTCCNGSQIPARAPPSSRAIHIFVVP